MKAELMHVRLFPEESTDSTAFVGHLYRDGTKIAVCQNNGKGEDTLIMYNSLTNKILFEAYATTRGLDPEAVIRQLLSEWRLKVACRTRTLYRLRHDQTDLWREIPIRYTQAVREQLQTQHGDQLETIANELYT